MKISVVIPAYNVSGYLPRCLESVFAQTHKPHEIIVADDGSTDDTAVRAAELGAYVIRRTNGGISAARNTAMQHASGEWIALLDADDRWDPEKLERQVACVRDDVVMVYTGATYFDDDGIRFAQLATDPVSARKMLRYRNPITPSSVLARRDALLQNHGFREGLASCEDWEMWVRLAKLGNFAAVPDPVTGYYVRPGSVSGDPARMLKGLDQILDSTILTDLRGLDRWAWRQRIRAAQTCSAGLIARENGLDSELGYMLQALLVWPSPFWQPRRIATLLVSLRNSMRRRAAIV